MQCQTCGRPVLPQAKYCGNCGAAVPVADAAAGSGTAGRWRFGLFIVVLLGIVVGGSILGWQTPAAKQARAKQPTLSGLYGQTAKPTNGDTPCYSVILPVGYSARSVADCIISGSYGGDQSSRFAVQPALGATQGLSHIISAWKSATAQDVDVQSEAAFALDGVDAVRIT